ncbi:hypothetical protein D3C85_1945650 [compost metagenome]
MGRRDRLPVNCLGRLHRRRKGTEVAAAVVPRRRLERQRKRGVRKVGEPEYAVQHQRAHTDGV